MKKVFLVVTLLSAISNIATGTDFDNNLCKEVRMPSKEELQKKLQKKGLGYYDEKTNISDKLANQEEHPFGVAMMVYQCNYDFDQNLGRENHPMTEMLTPAIIKTLLGDNPDAIKCLRNSGILEDIN